MLLYYGFGNFPGSHANGLQGARKWERSENKHIKEKADINKSKVFGNQKSNLVKIRPHIFQKLVYPVNLHKPSNGKKNVAIRIEESKTYVGHERM